MDEIIKSTTSISRGLDAIFTANSDGAPINKLAVAKIAVSPFQPRKNFDEAAITELSESIKLYGILQPLLVRPCDDHYELLAGERRLRAANYLGLQEVPVTICKVDDQTAMAFGLIENIQRENLNCIEEAEAYLKLLNDFQLSHDELASRVGKSRSHITNIMRLTRLADFVKSALMTDRISMGHARALLSLDLEKQSAIAQIIIDQDLSVRQTEVLIKKIGENKEGALNTHFYVQSDALKDNIATWQARLSQQFSLKSAISFDSAGRGKLTFTTPSAEAMQALIDQLI